MRQRTVTKILSFQKDQLKRNSPHSRTLKQIKLEHIVHVFLLLFCVGWLLLVFTLFYSDRDATKNGSIDDITLLHMDHDNLETKKQPMDSIISTRVDRDQNKDTTMNVDESNMERTQEPKYYVKVSRDAAMNVETEVQMQSLGGDGGHTFYSFLRSKECLPSELCTKCLEKGMPCSECVNCRCFCEHLCQRESTGTVQKIFHYHPFPEIDLGQHHRSKDKGKRLIPKIVHQTWKEHITPELYPIKSVFQASWKQKGWEHRFYTDDDAIKFLKTHFPQEVLEAYNTLIPTAFKADLFRYCVLFIHGGVYVDYDVLCETDLDHAIDLKVGFFVPVDIVDKCLWNGFIGSVPGHPFLAAAIETVVNYVRNRYTSVDIMNSLCHEGKADNYVVLHEDLYLSGPCLLGNVVNQVLGRPPQSKYDVHESYDLWLEEMGIPGDLQLLAFRTFSGADHFILPSKNSIIAGTNFAIGTKDDVEEESPAGNHYSSIPKKERIFGSFGVYQDMVSVNEEIRLVRATTSKR